MEASAKEAAWNFCAPTPDYDGLRKEVAAVFADKVMEVQTLVAKLQKTQRAAEQALDKRVPSRARRQHLCRTEVAGTRKPVLLDAVDAVLKGPGA